MQNQEPVKISPSHWSHQQAQEFLERHQKRSQKQLFLGMALFSLAILFWLVALPLFRLSHNNKFWYTLWMTSGPILSTTVLLWIHVRSRQHQKIFSQALDLLADGLTYQSLNDCLIIFFSEWQLPMDNARFCQKLRDVLQSLTPETAKSLTPRAWDVLGQLAKRDSSELAQTTQRVLKRLNPSVLSEHAVS